MVIWFLNFGVLKIEVRGFGNASLIFEIKSPTNLNLSTLTQIQR